MAIANCTLYIYEWGLYYIPYDTIVDYTIYLNEDAISRCVLYYIYIYIYIKPYKDAYYTVLINKMRILYYIYYLYKANFCML